MDIFNANNIKTYIFDQIKPTPLVSFGVRYLSCICGIVITASHNPPEYNGYKVYWSDGGQIVPPIDKKLIDYIIKRIDRSYSNISDFIYKIDQLSLKKKKSIDFKIIKEALGD